MALLFATGQILGCANGEKSKARRCERKALKEQQRGFCFELSSHSFRGFGSKMVVRLLADI
jgi:hypothetical protein